MYYSSGNYEAFATPKKPEGVDHKSAYIIGSGLAALTAACYLVRDGQMKGEHVHVFEKDPVPGGACDGYKYDIGYVMRGGREMDNHFDDYDQKKVYNDNPAEIAKQFEQMGFKRRVIRETSGFRDRAILSEFWLQL